MAKRGPFVAVTINGRKYVAPKDAECEITFGGTLITDTQHYADGTSDSVVTSVEPTVKGLKVKVDDEAEFYKIIAEPDNPVIIECVCKSYELVGSVVGDVTVNNKGLTSEFEIRATDGNGIRQS